MVEQFKRPHKSVYQLQRYDCDNIALQLTEIQNKFYVDKFYYLHILELQREQVANILEMNPILGSNYQQPAVSKNFKKLRDFIFKNQFVKHKSNFPTEA